MDFDATSEFLNQFDIYLSKDPLTGIQKIRKEIGDDHEFLRVIKLIIDSYPKHQEYLMNYLSLSLFLSFKHNNVDELDSFEIIKYEKYNIILDTLKVCIAGIPLVIKGRDSDKLYRSTEIALSALTDLIYTYSSEDINLKGKNPEVPILINSLIKQLTIFRDFANLDNRDETIISLNNIIKANEQFQNKIRALVS